MTYMATPPVVGSDLSCDEEGEERSKLFAVAFRPDRSSKERKNERTNLDFPASLTPTTDGRCRHFTRVQSARRLVRLKSPDPGGTELKIKDRKKNPLLLFSNSFVSIHLSGSHNWTVNSKFSLVRLDGSSGLRERC